MLAFRSVRQCYDTSENAGQHLPTNKKADRKIHESRRNPSKRTKDQNRYCGRKQVISRRSYPGQKAIGSNRSCLSLIAGGSRYAVGHMENGVTYQRSGRVQLFEEEKIGTAIANSRWKFGSNPPLGGCAACDARKRLSVRPRNRAHDGLAPYSNVFITGVFPGVASGAPSEQPPARY